MSKLNQKQTVERGYIVIDWSRIAAYDHIAGRKVDIHEAAICELAYRAWCAGGYLTTDQQSIATAIRIGRTSVGSRIAALERDGILIRQDLPFMAGRGQQLTLTDTVLAAICPPASAAAVAPVTAEQAQVSHAPARAKKAARWASPDAFALEAREVNASLPREKQVNDINGFVAYWAAIDEHTGKFAAEAAAAKSGRWSMAGRLATWRQREDTPRHGQQAPRQNSLDFAAEAFNLLSRR